MTLNLEPVPHPSLGQADTAQSANLSAHDLHLALPRAGAARSCWHRGSFSWRPRALQIAAWCVAGQLLLALIAIAAEGSAIKCCGFAWLSLQACLAYGLSRRAASPKPVVTIDQRGIHDRRLMPHRLDWQDITAVGGCDLARSQTIELFVKRPRWALKDASAASRFGGWLQDSFHVPALTISFLLIDGTAYDFAQSIASIRPDLLPETMRKAFKA